MSFFVSWHGLGRRSARGVFAHGALRQVPERKRIACRGTRDHGTYDTRSVFVEHERDGHAEECQAAEERAGPVDAKVGKRRGREKRETGSEGGPDDGVNRQSGGRPSEVGVDDVCGSNSNVSSPAVKGCTDGRSASHVQLNKARKTINTARPSMPIPIKGAQYETLL